MINEILTTEKLCRENIIGVKTEKQDRVYNMTVGSPVARAIKRTKYLKICWMCGTPYESHKYNTYACSPRCVQNMIYARRKGLNPPANMLELTKPKNIKEIKELFEYR